MSVTTRPPSDVPLTERQWLRRGELLEAARIVFERQGYHAATVSAIVQAAGLSQGAFYLYFADKKAVFAALQEEMATLLRRRIYWATRDEADPARRLEAGLRAYFEFYEEYRDWNHRLMVEGLGIDKTFEARQVGLYETLAVAFRPTLVELGAADAELSAAALTGMGLQVAYARHFQRDRAIAKSAAELAHECAQLFLYGVTSHINQTAQGGTYA